MKILVIGCGGIGSYYAQHIDRLISLKQINEKECSFTFYDDDIVELKNILYQNFLPKDVDSLKTKALARRFLYLNFSEKRLIEKDLAEIKPNLIVICADNNLIRRQVYSHFKKTTIPFIDARANGKTIGIFSNETNNYEGTMSSSDESQSCQNPFQLEKQEIEFGNVVVASILAQVTLTYVRNKKLPNDLLINV